MCVCVIVPGGPPWPSSKCNQPDLEKRGCCICPRCGWKLGLCHLSSPRSSQSCSNPPSPRYLASLGSPFQGACWQHLIMNGCPDPLDHQPSLLPGLSRITPVPGGRALSESSSGLKPSSCTRLAKEFGPLGACGERSSASWENLAL